MKKLFVISGSSGVGKGTIIKKFLEKRRPNFTSVILFFQNVAIISLIALTVKSNFSFEKFTPALKSIFNARFMLPPLQMLLTYESIFSPSFNLNNGMPALSFCIASSKRFSSFSSAMISQFSGRSDFSFSIPYQSRGEQAIMRVPLKTCILSM